MRRILVLALAPLVACHPSPEISDLAVVTKDFVAGIGFVATDRDADLDGGFVNLDFGGHQVRYALTSDDRQEERDGTVISMAYVYPACRAGESATVSVSLEDAWGGRSNALVTVSDLHGEAIEEDEPNDSSDYATFQAWDDEVEAIGFCGEIDRTGVNSNNFYVEDDWFEFRPNYQGEVQVTLQAPIGSEFDLWLFDQHGDEDVVRWDEAVQGGGFQYMTAKLPFEDGGYVYASVGAAGGMTGPYSLYVEQPR